MNNTKSRVYPLLGDLASDYKKSGFSQYIKQLSDASREIKSIYSRVKTADDLDSSWFKSESSRAWDRHSKIIDSIVGDAKRKYGLKLDKETEKAFRDFFIDGPDDPDGIYRPMINSGARKAYRDFIDKWYEGND